MKTLKMKSSIFILFTIIILWGTAACLTYTFFPALLISRQTPIPLESVDFNGNIEGLYVSGTLHCIYDSYMEAYDDDKLVAKSYLIDADENYYICLRAQQDDMDAADKLVEASYEYWNNQKDENLLAQAQYEIEGVIKPLSLEEQGYVFDYFEWEAEESTDYFLPYYIDVNSYGVCTKSELFSFMALSVIFFLWGSFFIIKLLTGGYQKSVKRYIKNSSTPELTRERVEDFIKKTPEINGLRYNQNFICGQYKGKTAFGETSKLAWVYIHTITHRRLFIPISETYLLMLCFSDGTKQMARVKNESIAEEHMKNLAKLCPQCIYGFDEELEEVFSNNLSDFLDIQYNKVLQDDIFA